MKQPTTIPLRATLLLLALLAVIGQASATEIIEDNDIFYFTSNQDAWGNPTEEFAIAVDCKDYISNLVIPEKVSYNGKTYTVKQVGGFGGKSSITSVVIGDSVQQITGTAFENCSNLSTLTIGKSVNYIDQSSFTGCHIKKLIYKAENEIDYDYGWDYFPFEEVEQVEIGNNVGSIPNNFCYETNLTEVVIPASVMTIGAGAFYHCANLNSVSISSVELTIYGSAFCNCPNLRNLSFSSSATEITLQNDVFANCGFLNLTIPASIIKMGKRCFTGCRDLQSVNVSAANTHYDSRNNCNAIIETATNTLVAGCMNTIIPNSVTKIGVSAFRDCVNLTEITIPNSVKIIDSSAFGDCSNLTSIDIPNSVTEIRSSFYNTGLRNVVIPNSVKILEGGAFADCKQLTSVIIGDSVEFIGDLAFSGCEQLVNIQIPGNVKIVSGTEYGVSGATFLGSPWYNNQPDGLLYIGRAAYHYLGTMPANTKLVIREGTYSISDNAFGGRKYFYHYKDHDCSGLTSISLPNSLRFIGDRAFEGCNGLTEIVIPDSVIMLGDDAFEECMNLNSVTIGRGVKTIASDVFSRCSNLVSVTCLATNPPLIRRVHDDDPYTYILSGRDDVVNWETDIECFDERAYTEAVLFVPKGSEAAYMLADKWKRFIHIVGIDVHTDACDVNGDGVVNISDLNNVVNDILSGKGDSLMDVNGDGSVNISDINIIVQSILTSN